MHLISLTCQTPIVIMGQHVNWSSFSRWNVQNNWCWRVRLGNIRASARLMAAFSGFYEIHDPPPLGNACDRVPCIAVAIKTAIKVGTCYIFFCLLSPWWPLGQYGVSSRRMVATSGFWCSPGHAALGDAACIASTPHHGHRNGLRWRCIRSSLLIFCLA